MKVAIAIKLNEKLHNSSRKFYIGNRYIGVIGIYEEQNYVFF